MEMVLVTVVGSQRSVDLQVPGELTLGELLPTMLEVCCLPTEALSMRGQVGWQVVYGQISLSPGRSLLESGVLDGAVLLLQNSAAPMMRPPVQEKRPQQFIPRSVSPSQGTGGIGVHWSKDGFGADE